MAVGPRRRRVWFRQPASASRAFSVSFNTRSRKLSVPIKRRNASKSAATQSVELAFAVPQVVAHRMTRMALAGSSPSKADRQEFNEMVSEKQSAFSQAWIAMATETLRTNQSIATSLFGGLLFPRSGTRSSMASITKTMQNASKSIFSKGLAPIHRTAVANSKRLGKAKAR